MSILSLEVASVVSSEPELSLMISIEGTRRSSEGLRLGVAKHHYVLGVKGDDEVITVEGNLSDFPLGATMLAAINASSRTMSGGIPMLSRAIRPINSAVAAAAVTPRIRSTV